MTEKQLDHAISVEQADVDIRAEVVSATVRTETRAQWFTFVIVLVFLGLAGYSLHLGQPLGAVAGGLAAIGTIAYAIRGQKNTIDNSTDSKDDASESTN